MIIECNAISQNINELLIAFQDCKKIKNSDLRKMVELISAVNICNNGGPNYDTLITNVYNTSQTVTYPINSFHSFSLSIISGSIVYNGVTLPEGAVKNIEYTTLNQIPVSFIVNTASQVLVEYLIETV
jgi:hypothetical protein